MNHPPQLLRAHEVLSIFDRHSVKPSHAPALFHRLTLPGIIRYTRAYAEGVKQFSLARGEKAVSRAALERYALSPAANIVMDTTEATIETTLSHHARYEAITAPLLRATLGISRRELEGLISESSLEVYGPHDRQDISLTSLKGLIAWHRPILQAN